MRLEQLQYIIAVAKYKSVSKAAKQLFISQPSLSSAINNLEKELHTKVFNRTPEGIEVTELGQIIIEKAFVILQEVEELQNIVFDSTPNMKGSITISTTPAMNNIILEAFSTYKEKYSMVNIYIKENDNLGTLRELRSGDIDLGIIGMSYYDRDLIKTLDKHLRYEKLLTDECYLYVAKNHDLLKERSTKTKNIKQYPVITYKNNWTNKEIEEFIDFQPSEVIRFNDFESIKKLIIRGKAVGIMPSVAFSNDIYITAGQIVPLKILDADYVLDIGMVYRKDYIQTPLKKFILTLTNIVLNA